MAAPIDLESIKVLLTRLGSNLPSGYDIASISTTAKIPMKVLSLREALIYRMFEISTAATNLYSEKQFITSCILTRSALETTAMLFWLQKRIENVVSENTVGDFDDWLMRALLGDRDGSITGERDAPSIISGVEKVDAVYNGFRSEYNFLSEFTHPNWAGTYGSYGTDDKKNWRIEFHPSSGRDNSKSWEFILNNLSATLEIFILHYNRISEFHEEFTKICESDLGDNK